MTWFTKLTGIDEESPAQVRQELSVDGQHLVCPDGKRIAFGRLETPNLAKLRKAVTDLNSEPRRPTIREIVGGVFGNRDEWITDAIGRAFFMHKQQGLDVQVVSYSQSKRAVTKLIERIGNSAS